MKKTNATRNATLPTNYKILQLIEQGLTVAPKLIRILMMNKTTIYRHLYNLTEQRLISKLGKSPAVYSATARGRIELMNFIKHTKSRTKLHKVALPSLRLVPQKTRVHALAIKYPLLEDNFTGDWDKVVSNFKNSIKNYIFIPEASVTIEKTSKSIILHIHKKTINTRELLSGYLEWLNSLTAFTYYFLLKKGIKFDHWNGKIIRQHIATKAEDFEERVGKGTFEIDLNRKAKSYFPSSMDAKAWIDRSKGGLEIESNDLPYKEKFLLMPELIFEIDNNVSDFKDNLELYNRSLKVYDKNIKLHIEVMTEMKNTLKEMRNIMESD